MLREELKSIWKDKKFTLSIIVMFFMPILYSGMLLWAFWDPYGSIEDLPVALVNEDEGAEMDGEQLALGKELVDKLIEEKQFDFFEVPADEANQRLENQEFYLLIKIPKNFSEHATTLLEDNPEKLQIEYIPNEGYNFLSSKIGDTAIEKIRAEVNNQVAKTYAEKLYDSIDQLSNGLGDAAEGSSELADGIKKVAEGTTDLKGYLEQLASSTITLADGTKTLYSGIKSASDGAKTLASSTSQLSNGISQLKDGANTLSSGSSSLQEGLSKYTSGVDELTSKYQMLLENQQTLQNAMGSVSNGASSIATNAASLAEGTEGLAQGIGNLQTQLQAVIAMLPADQQAALNASLEQLATASTTIAGGAQQLAKGTSDFSTSVATLTEKNAQLSAGYSQVGDALTQISGNSESLRSGMAEIANGQQTLAAKLGEASDGAVKLTDGANSLSNGLAQIVSGSNTLTNGTSTLAEKSGELSNGVSDLVDGTSQLQDGANELSNALTDAKEQSKINYSDSTIDMTVSPVEVKDKAINEVDTYGGGFTPYFVSLGLFVGALLLTNVYPYVQPSIHPTSVWRWFGSKSFIPVVVMLGQVVLVLFVLVKGLGLEVENFWLLALTTLVTSFSFMAIVQVLTVVMGDVGRFLALVLLIVQLTSSAGTFPIELLPSFFQKVHDFMPMKYSIQAYRDVIANTSTNFTHSLIVLTTIGVICVAVTFAFFLLLYKRRYSKEQVA